jgi:hypothetical protein
MTDIAKRPTNPQADDGEELWGKLEHRKFEGYPRPDAHPERRYDAATQKEMLEEIERQKKLIQVPTRADIDALIAELVRRPVDDLRAPLARARAALIAIRDHADHGMRDTPDADLADARQHLSLISCMANASVRSIDGDPGYL